MSKESELLEKLKQAVALLNDCIANLEPGKAGRKSARSEKTKPPQKPGSLVFDINERAFVKSHARGLSGQKKFTLLVAFLAKGKSGVEVKLSDVEKLWNRMTASNLLGGRFNRFYSNVARENGWVNTKKQGIYVLTAHWRDALAG